MNDIDPLTGHIENLQDSLTQGATASMAGGIASVDVGPDGSLRAIRLTDSGRRLDPDTLVEAIVRLHATALAEARKSVADAVTRLENDPRLLTQREHLIDTLHQPPPGQSAAAPSFPWPQQAPASRREAMPDEEEELDSYYQRKSWLEY
ncbi:hypothetical protein [Nocardia sp. NPDC051570]|uniref:hypothetical protein n=1 Tax=Nocardia sp. NPDC051570 TaxID=3364324 RepID=UPI0037ACA025